MQVTNFTGVTNFLAEQYMLLNFKLCCHNININETYLM